MSVNLLETIRPETPRSSRRVCLWARSWVMVSPNTNPPFQPLPNEKLLSSPSLRVALSLSTPAHYPGRQQQPFSISHPKGTCYLTNTRIIYLPDKPTDNFKSFAAQLLNIHDAHPNNPIFGAPGWTASVQPVNGGGIPVPPTGVVELKLTFKEGGAFEFQQAYERVRERLQQVVDVSRIHGDGSGRSAGAMNGVDVSNVNLEQLPAYQEESDGPLIPPTASAAAIAQAQARQHRSPVIQQEARDSGVGVDDSNERQPKPDEPPPGYEESQLSGVQDELERRLERDQR